jgi:hypothetical protein
MTRSKSVAHGTTTLSLEDEIARLRDLDLKALRARWKGVYRHDAPLHLPRHLLFAVLAYRLQADELGDLTPDSARLLKQLGTNDSPLDVARLTSSFDQQRTKPNSGTVLTREWKGQIHQVMVMDEGFGWNGKTYDSLSQVAYAITGTKWNGPRFFGLRYAAPTEASS